MTTPSALYLGHCAADHQFAAGDTHDILPGIDPNQAIETARRIIASPYHDDCPTCHPDPKYPEEPCGVCDRISRSCTFGSPRGLCSCWRGVPCA